MRTFHPPASNASPLLLLYVGAHPVRDHPTERWRRGTAVAHRVRSYS